MRAGERSRTADAAAAFRASHTLYAQAKVFEDPYALELTSPGWRTLLSRRWLHRLVLTRLLRGLSPVVAQVIGRSRYAEDLLAAAIAHGVTQYVIVGAGLDSFALRRPDLEQTLRIYEVDHPDTQRGKHAQLMARGRALPTNLEFAAVDFECEGIVAGLRRSSYRPELPAFFSWLGTTHYLRPQATLDTLKSIAGLAAAGSEIVFDYSLSRELLPTQLSRAAQRLHRSTARQGEPMIGGLNPHRLHGDLRRLGYEIVEDLSGNELAQRYFRGRDDGLKPTSASRLMHARLRKR